MQTLRRHPRRPLPLQPFVTGTWLWGEPRVCLRHQLAISTLIWARLEEFLQPEMDAQLHGFLLSLPRSFLLPKKERLGGSIPSGCESWGL